MSFIPLGILAAAGGGGGGAYESIATATPSGTGTVTFSSIPSTYTSLQVRVHALIDATGNGISARLNADSSQIYTRHRLTGDGATVTSDGATTGVGLTSAAIMSNARSTTAPCVVILDLHNYASTTQNKTLRSFAGTDSNGDGRINLFSSLYVSTSAITSIEIFTAANFTSGTRIALYGIKGA